MTSVSDTCTVQGHRMYLDRYDTLDLQRRGVFEPVATALLPRLVYPGDTVVDVGANIGYYTLLCARLVGEHGRVYAFEPEPRNFALLMQNIACNGYGNVIADRRALSAANGKARLWVNLGSNQGDHRVYDPGEANRQAISIEATTLDAALPEPVTVNLVKMDIQGGELQALHGMRQVLTRSPGARLLTEFWPLGLQRAGTSAGAFLDALSALGFIRWLDVDEQARQVVISDRRTLLGRYPPTEDRFTNLICARASDEEFARLA